MKEKDIWLKVFGLHEGMRVIVNWPSSPFHKKKGTIFHRSPYYYFVHFDKPVKDKFGPGELTFYWFQEEKLEAIL